MGTLFMVFGTSAFGDPEQIHWWAVGGQVKAVLAVVAWSAIATYLIILICE